MQSGYNYGFGIYSKALKAQFELSQQQLVNINTIPYCFGVLSPLCGMLANKMGPRLTMLVGGGLMGSIQLINYMVTSKSISVSHPATTLVVISVATYLPMAMVTSACFASPVIHYQKHRG